TTASRCSTRYSTTCWTSATAGTTTEGTTHEPHDGRADEPGPRADAAGPDTAGSDADLPTRPRGGPRARPHPLRRRPRDAARRRGPRDGATLPARAPRGPQRAAPDGHRHGRGRHRPALRRGGDLRRG